MNTRLQVVTASIALALAPCHTSAGQDEAPADTQVAAPAAASPGAIPGERSYAACAACHGPAGEGIRAVHAPVIGGLDAAYVARQVRYFREGLRGGDPGDHVGRPMHLVALTHPPEGRLDALARFIAGMPGGLEPRDPAAAPDHPGAQVYGTCVACHGSRAEGNPALGGPALGGQHQAYLLRQLRAFRSGRRGSDEADIYGRQMAAAVSGLSDEQLESVAAFLAGPEH